MTFAVVEVADPSSSPRACASLGEFAHAVRVLAGVLLDGLGRAAVRITLAQHRIHRAAENLAVALSNSFSSSVFGCAG